ncbi:hypothetical protein VNO78_00306 [Psophocarpus tetragonolobus]|uniref:Thaumatin-like protein n=1 Tax=Psophocarpus tetragonolobus TaxID=3891 RepID=A0AAN9T0A7_PSOTE
MTLSFPFLPTLHLYLLAIASGKNSTVHTKTENKTLAEMVTNCGVGVGVGVGAGAASTTMFTLVNKCDYTVWPGILSNAGIEPLPTTGFVLQTGESKTMTAPTSWGGRFWGRTLCTQDAAGKFSCVTGDCGSGKLECAGNGATPPATLAEFTLDGAGGLDFFDVSLVDGYNVAMLVAPHGGTGDNCTITGCVGDLNGNCPSELKVTSEDGKQSVACKSACEAFGSPQYCCTGAYGSPNTCKPTAYSQMFKNTCPRAYSYAYDDKTSTFTCASAPAYTITFCPSPHSNPR